MSIEKWKTVNLSRVLNRLIRCEVQTCVTDNRLDSFTDNQIGDKEIVSLSQILKTSVSLTQLDLSCELEC